MFQISKKAVIRRIICSVLLMAVAYAVNYSSTLGWGGAWAPGDTRYKVSPIGISHVLQPRQAVSPIVWSQWSPETGDPHLRSIAPGGELAYMRLKLINPILQLGFWLALAGAVIVLLPFRKRQSRLLFPVIAAGSAVTVVASVVLFITSASSALAVLAQLEDFGYGGSFGSMLAGVAPLLIVGAMGLFLPRLRWLPFLVLLIFNLAVWYQSLLFLVPIAIVLFFTANFFAVSKADDMNGFVTAG